MTWVRGLLGAAQAVLLLQLLLPMVLPVSVLGAVETVALFQQPSGGIERETLLQQPKVRILDEAGALVLEPQTVSVEAVPSQQILGNTRLTSVGGSANFTDLVLIDKGSLQLRFTLDGLTAETTSNVFTVQDGFESMFVTCPQSGGLSSHIVEAVAGAELRGTSNCSSQGRYPEVSLAGTDGGIVHNTHLPVTVFINSPQATLTGTITERSCCKMHGCSQLNSASDTCCDCNNPACALCVIAYDGRAFFQGLSIDKVGTYQLQYKVDQFSIFSEGGQQSTRVTQLVDASSFKIVSGPPDSLAVLVQPGDAAIGGTQGDQPGLLNPMPELVFSDDQQNPSDAAATGRVIAMGCVQGTDPYADDIPGVCLCSDEACLLQPTVSDLLDKASLSFQGNVSITFVGGVATYTDLSIRIARSDMRIAFHRISDAGPANKYVVSDVFSINPGKLDHMSLEDQPALASGRGCARCPQSLHWADSDMRAVLKMRDKLGNVISSCGTASSFCVSVATSSVRAQLLLDGVDVSATHLVSSTDGTDIVNAEFGTATFSRLRARVSGHMYTLRFVTTGYFFSETSSNIAIDVVTDSLPFAVVSGPPVQLVSNSLGVITSTDLEAMSTDLSFDLTDSMGNLVVSDCYTDCRGTLPALCTNTSDSCDPLVNVTVKYHDALLRGVVSRPAVKGNAMFPGLVLEALASQCGSSDADRLIILNVSTLDLNETLQGVQLELRVTQMSVVDQPTAVVARETFITAPRVRVLDCLNNLVGSAVAQIVVAIRANAGGGKLSGTMSVPLEGGMASFSDITIDLQGAGYTLEFSYVGNAQVSPLVSQAFTIEAPVSRIDIVSGPGGTTTVASVPFASQPLLSLKSSDGSVVDSSALITASILQNPGKLQAHDPDRVQLLGTTIVRAVRGDVTFTDLAINKASIGQALAQEGYSLYFLLNDFGSETATFSITPGAWEGLFIAQTEQPGPPGRGTATESVAGDALKRQPIVYLVDRFTNIILPSQVPATVPDTGGPVVIQASLLSSTQGVVLQRNCADQQEVCLGSRPIRCSTCTDMRSLISNSRATWQGLRIDIASPPEGYRLQFNATGFGFSVTSMPFYVQNTVPDYPFVSNLDQMLTSAVADKPLQVQPKVSVRDRFGNSLVFDDIPDRRVKTRILTLSGQPPQPPGMPPAPGQREDSICTVWPNLLEGTAIVAVDLETGEGVFTDLAVRHVMEGYKLEFEMATSVGTLYANTSEFRVLPGSTIAICGMQQPARCSDGGQCRDKGVIACVDAYGNIQPSCATCFGDRCGDSPFNTPGYVNVDCRGGVCVSLANGPPGSKVSSVSSGSDNCAEQFCTVPLSQGTSHFTDITLSNFAPGYSLTFKAYVVDSYTEMVHEWSYTTDNFTVAPVSPIISSVQFTDSLGQLRVNFDRETNMNSATSSGEAACASTFDPSFLASLGAGPFCTWPSPSQLLVSVGADAYVNASTRVLLSQASDITAVSHYLGMPVKSLPATTVKGLIVGGQQIGDIFPMYPAQLPLPLPAFTTTRRLTACSLVEADGGYSAGNGGRPFLESDWSLDMRESSAIQGILDARLPVASWYKNRISFTSFLPGEVNTITITLRPETPILPGSNMTITGLPGFIPRTRDCPLNLDGDAVWVKCLGAESMCQSIPLMGPSRHLFSGDKVTNNGGPVLQHYQGILEKHIIFQVRPDSFVPNDEDTVFSFDIVNPFVEFAQSTIKLTVTCDECMCMDDACTTTQSYGFGAKNFDTNCDRLCTDQAATYEVLDKELSSPTGTITETSSVMGASNIITVSFTPSDPLPPRTTITIGGISAVAPSDGPVCLTGPDKTIFSCSDCSGGSLHRGMWQNGELVLQVRNDSNVRSDAPTVFSFEVKNAATSMRASCGAADPNSCDSSIRPTLSMVYIPTTVYQLPAYVLAGNVLGSGSVPQLYGVSVEETHSIRSAVNLITFRLQSNIILQPGAQILVTGLEGSSHGSGPTTIYTPEGVVVGDIPIPLSECFIQGGATSTALLDASSSSLSFQVSEACTIPAGFPLTLAVAIKNPAATQPPPTIRVSASHPGCSDCQATCTCSMGPRQAFSLPAVGASGVIFGANDALSVNLKTIMQDNAVASQLNNITVTITVPLLLKPSTLITISGLTGLLTPSGSLPILEEDHTVHAFTSVVGQWDASLGTLIFQIQTAVPAGDILSATFEVRNGAVASSGTPRVEMSAGVDICGETHAACPPGFLSDQVAVPATELQGSVLRLGTAPALKVRTIRELTRVMGAYNVLIVRITANFDLLPGATITVSGLANTQSPSVQQITVVSDVLQLLPNCSCAPAPVETATCGTCSSSTLAVINQQFRVWQPDADVAGWTYFGKPAMVGTHPSTDLEGGGMVGSWSNDAGVCGSECGRLVVTVTEGGGGRTLSGGRELVFGFALTNSGATIPPTTPRVSLNNGGGITIVGDVMQGSVLGPVLDAGFEMASMVADTQVHGDYANITLSIRANAPLVSLGSPGVAITISGLTGFETSSGILSLLGPDAFAVSKGATAVWNSELGELVLNGATLFGGCDSMPSPGDCAMPEDAGSLPSNQFLGRRATSVFSFVLKRPVTVTSPPILPQLSASSSAILISNKKTFSGSASSTVGSTGAALLMRRVTQSSATQGSFNVITVSLTMNAHIYPFTEITLSGLFGAQTDSTSSFPLVSVTEGLFMETAVWNQTFGTLTITTASLIAANDEMVFSFQLTNPPASQPPALIVAKVTSFGPLQNGQLVPREAALTTDWSALTVGAGNIGIGILGGEQPPEFAHREIGESTLVDYAINTVTVTLAANVPLQEQGNITLSSLVSLTPSGVIPLYNSNASFRGESGIWMQDAQTLKLTLARTVHPSDPPLVFSFRLQNPQCTSSPCTAASVSVELQGGDRAPSIGVDPAPMFGNVLGGGAALSWVLRKVQQSVSMVHVHNTLTFHVSPNAPIYPGSLMTFRGIRGTQSATCSRCTGVGDLVPGLGCHDHCLKCVGNCLVILNSTMQPHPAFLDGLGQWDMEAGTLTVAVAPKAILREDEIVELSVQVRNHHQQQPRQDCSSLNTEADIDGGLCLTISSSSAYVCDRSASVPAALSEACADSGIPPSQISYYTPAVDDHNVPLSDACSVCIRNSDLLALDTALHREPRLTFQDLEVFPPTSVGLPYLIIGGAVEASYFVRLRLTNWVGAVAEVTEPLLKEEGGYGKMSEDGRPQVYIAGLTTRAMTADMPFELLAITSAASCADPLITGVAVSWRMECISGPCSLVPSLENAVAPLGCSQNQQDALATPRLNLLQGSLPAGVELRFYARGDQDGFNPSFTEADVNVTVTVRPPVPILSGVSSLGPISRSAGATIDSHLSLDPEYGTTNMTQAMFARMWSCTQQDLSHTSCPAPPLICPEPPSHPCPPGVISDISSPSVHLNSSFLVSGITYTVSLSLSRTAENLREPLLPFAHLYTPPGHAQVTVTAVELAEEPTLIRVRRCDALALGDEDACEQRPPLSGRVNAGESLAVYADAVDRFGNEVLGSFLWSDHSVVARHFLGSNLATSLQSQLLVLNPSAFVPGHLSRFHVQFTPLDPANVQAGYAQIEVVTSVPPLGGSMTLSPSSGVSLTTVFVLQAQGWTVPVDALPLSYRFFTLDVAGSGVKSTLSTVATLTLQTVLPAGNKDDSDRLEVGVEVSDAFGAKAERLTSAFVQDSLGSGQESLAQLTALLDSGASCDLGERLSTVISLMSSLNAAGGACARLTDPSSIPAECESIVSSRRTLRKRVLEELLEATDGKAMTPAQIDMQVSILQSVGSRPAEMDPSIIELSASVITSSVASARQATVDATSFANSLGGVVDNLLAVNQQISGGRRALSATTSKLMSAISTVSSASVMSVQDGMAARALDKTTYKAMTQRVAISGYTGSSLTITGSPAATSVSFPRDLFQQLAQSLPAATVSAELMLVAFNFSSNPIAGALGPVIMIEVRPYTSTTAFQFKSVLQTPLQMQLSSIVNVSQPADPRTGMRPSRFGMYYDEQAQVWSTAGMSFVSGDSDHVKMTSTHMSYFALVRVMAGCDDLPLSSRVFDHCAVCGGNNGTCSGCDGIPNTGRDKGCSGHGQCGVSTCSCVFNWYGIMCNVFCSDQTTCSGHGRCNSGSGAACVCDEDWSSGNVGYPGPFCREAVVVAPSTSPRPGEEKKVQGQEILIIVLPCVAAVLLVALAIWFFLRRQKQKLRHQRKTVIEFTAPKSLEEEEAAPLAIEDGKKKAGKGKGTKAIKDYVPVADEAGWDDGQPTFTAALSFGPTSGQLASAIASNTKTNIGQMSVERIDRRTKVMSSQIGSRKTMNKYAQPRGLPSLGDDSGLLIGDGEKERTDFGDGHEEEDMGEMTTTWQMTNLPEWLRSRNNQNGEFDEEGNRLDPDRTPHDGAHEGGQAANGNGEPRGTKTVTINVYPEGPEGGE